MGEGSDRPDEARRDASHRLLAGAVCAWLAGWAWPVTRYLGEGARAAGEEAEAARVVLPGAASLAPGQSRYFRLGTEPGLLLRTPDGEWRAYGAFCTHLNCTVEYRPAERRIFCACHHGQFEVLSGAPTGGPPARPLTSLTVSVQGTDVVVERT